MFHRDRDASKVALLGLVELLHDEHAGDRLLDVQWVTPHLATLGAVEVARPTYLRLLERALRVPLPVGWQGGPGPTPTQGEHMKIALVAASLVLVAGGAAACGNDDGGDDGSAKGASKDDFCAAFQAFYDDIQGVSGQEENLGEILKKAAQRIEDAGTPDDIPDDAEEGLQLTLDAIDELPDDASAEDMAGLDADLTDEEKKKVDAFTDYLVKTCPDIGGGGASDDSSGGSSGEGSDDGS